MVKLCRGRAEGAYPAKSAVTSPASERCLSVAIATAPPCDGDVLEYDAPERILVTKAFQGIEYLYTSEISVSIVIRGESFSQVFGCDGALAEADIKRIDLGIIRYSHFDSPQK